MTQETLAEWDDESSDADGRGRSPAVGVDSDGNEGAPPRCLSVTVSGPWGHFRRIEGNIVKQTYRVIPRTTVAGLLAAVLGIGRDDYYDLFASRHSAIAIEPTEKLRTVNMPMNTLSTAKEAMRSLNSRGKVSVKLPDPTKLRQQHNYEVLVEPEYRLYVWLADAERFDELAEMLEDGRSHYVPSLGLSEHLAELDYHGIAEVEAGPNEGLVSVDSAVPNAIDRVVLDEGEGARCQVEESPAFMETDGGGRTTTGFTSYAYNPDAGPLTVRDPETCVVGDKTVMFV